jgi:hypothetical protein
MLESEIQNLMNQTKTTESSGGETSEATVAADSSSGGQNQTTQTQSAASESSQNDQAQAPAPAHSVFGVWLPSQNTEGVPTVSDAIAPSVINNLAISGFSTSTITLIWTASGDDNNAGTAASYDIRYSTSTITSENWPLATPVTGAPAPLPAGNSQSMIVSGLSSGRTYYFAVKTRDEAANESGLSNVASGATAFWPPILISEILFDAAGADEGKEYIELYNPTTSTLDLSGWSLKYFKGNAASTTSLAVFKTASHPEDQTTIPANDFLLIGLNNYNASNYNNKSADIKRTAALPNGEEQVTVVLSDNQDTEADRIVYNSNSIAAAGQSLERKAFSHNQCAAASGSGEFLGNGCDGAQINADDTQISADFEIRNNPNPQNSQSLPEPRNTPTAPQNFAIQYSSSASQLIFNWQTSQDSSGATSTLTYKITDISASSTLPIIETASTTASAIISEIGRPYDFSIQSFDRDGLSSAATNSSISVPINTLPIEFGNYTSPDQVICNWSGCAARIFVSASGFVDPIGLYLSWPYGWYGPKDYHARLTIKNDSNGSMGSDIAASETLSVYVNPSNPPSGVFNFRFAATPYLAANNYYWLYFTDVEGVRVNVWGNANGWYYKGLSYSGDMAFETSQNNVFNAAAVNLSGRAKIIAPSSLSLSYGLTADGAQTQLNEFSFGPTTADQAWTNTISLPPGSWALVAKLLNQSDIVDSATLYLGAERSFSEGELPTASSTEEIILVNQAAGDSAVCERECGQQIFPLSHGFLTTVQLKLQWPFGWYGHGDYHSYVVIRDDNNGQPGNIIAASETVATYINPSNPPPPGVFTFNFPSQPLLKAQNFYWLMFYNVEGIHVNLFGTPDGSAMPGNNWYHGALRNDNDIYAVIKGLAGQ